MVYPLGRSPFLGGLLLAFWLAGLVSVLLWWNVSRQADGRLLLAACCLLLSGLAAGIGWKNLSGGRLAWDGDAWRWESAGYATGAGEYSLSVIADFQQRLVLRLENQAGASLWLWAERSAMPERWLDLRRAIYSPHRVGTSRPAHGPVPAGPADDAQPAAVAPSQAMPTPHASQARP